MVSAFDQRIIQAGIEINGEIITFEGLNIQARGSKFTSSAMGTIDLRIYNLTADHRKFILTQASPIARAPTLHPINLTLDVGRESYGTFRLFEGQVFAGGAMQPPDIGILLNGLANNFQLSMTSAYTQSSIATLRKISEQVAAANQLSLDFTKATDKQIENFSYTGTPHGLIVKLNEMGGILAYQDNKTLIVCDTDKARGNSVRVINQDTGMVGVPQPTASGCIVQVMIDNSIVVGQEVRVESVINPGVNGNYFIRQMDFEVASRDNPFWYTLQCQAKELFTGGTQ